MRVLGMMSGTSLDGIDVAYCEFAPDREVPNGLTLRLMGYNERPFPTELRTRLLDHFRQESVARNDLPALNFDLGHIFGEAARSGAEALGIDLADVDLIASHGQTIYHLIEPKRRATIQMGEPSVIAAVTGRTVVANFRPADMAVGGQGAPLVSLFDALFFGGDGKTRAIQNIGGIGNVTFVTPGRVWGFDTGPGNLMMNAAARRFTRGGLSCDRDGMMAAAGVVDRAVVEEVMANPYFRIPPPRTADRKDFGEDMAEALIAMGRLRGHKDDDTMATLTAITAESIARSYRDFGPPTLDAVVLAGGGASNPTLVEEIRQRLSPTPVVSHDDTGVPGSAKEAVAFALLGYETIQGRPGNVPSCTGAGRAVVLGQIAPGENYCQIMQRAVEEKGWRETRSLRLGP